MAGTKQLLVKVAGDITGAKNALNDLGGSVDGVGQRMSGIGDRMTVGVTLPIVAGFVAATHAAADEAQEMAVLQHAVEQNTGATAGQVAALETWITATQNATGVADSLIRTGLTELISKGNSVAESQTIMTAAMDISAATGNDLGAVLDALAKAANGNVTALGRMGLSMKDAEGNALSFDQILAQVSDRMGGSAAAAADTVAGRMAIAQAKFADAAETLGTALIPVMETAAGIISSLAGWFTNLSEGGQRMIIVIAGIAAAIGPLLSVIGRLIVAFSNPYIAGAALVFTAIAGAFVFFSGKAAEARARVDELADAMADGTPKAQAFGDAVLAWQEGLDTAELDALNRGLAIMGTNYSELVGRVQDGSLSLADFNALMDAAIAAQIGLTPVTRGASTEISAEGAALQGLQTEVNATSAALIEAETRTRLEAAAMNEATSLGALMRSRMGEVTGAQQDLTAATEDAAAAVATEAQTFAQIVAPATDLWNALDRARQAQIDLTTAQTEHGQNSVEFQQAYFDNASAVAGLRDALNDARSASGSGLGAVTGDARLAWEELKRVQSEARETLAALNAIGSGTFRPKIILETTITGSGAAFLGGRAF